MKDSSMNNNDNNKEKDESRKKTISLDSPEQQHSAKEKETTLSAQKDQNSASAETSGEKTLKEAIVQEATEYEAPHSPNFTLKKILGGDILNARFIRNQMGLILLIVAFVIVYISNRYAIQKNLIEISNLQTELQNAKYQALSSSSQLTERSRESVVLNLLKNNKDSALHIANRPPYIINVPDKDE